jgi:hypothetical protein
LLKDSQPKSHQNEFRQKRISATVEEWEKEEEEEWERRRRRRRGRSKRRTRV